MTRNRIILPMKAHIGALTDLDLKHMIFEPKLDGIRALCYANAALKFYSRNRIDITKDYPEFNVRSAIKAKSAVLDGEIVVLDESLTPRFHLWQKGKPAVYIVFDILMLNGKSVMDLPLLERKKLLEETVVNGPNIEKIVFTTYGQRLWDEMIKRDMEGVIAKQENSLYYPGKRTKNWLKIKAFKALEAIIIGYVPGKRVIGSIALGIYDNDKLVYIGNVGTGFTDSFLAQLYVQLKKLEIALSPVQAVVKGIIWVKPIIVCEIKYLEFTPAAIVRAAVFLRLRPDKAAHEVTFQEQDLR